MPAVSHTKKTKLCRTIHEQRMVSIIIKWIKLLREERKLDSYYLLQLSGGREHFRRMILLCQNCVYSDFVFTRCVFVSGDNRWTFCVVVIFRLVAVHRCCMLLRSCVLLFGWASQLDLWKGRVSYCLSRCVLMEYRNLYASFHSSLIAIDFWSSPLPVLKGDVKTEKMCLPVNKGFSLSAERVKKLQRRTVTEQWQRL